MTTTPAKLTANDLADRLRAKEQECETLRENLKKLKAAAVHLKERFVELSARPTPEQMSETLGKLAEIKTRLEYKTAELDEIRLEKSREEERFREEREGLERDRARALNALEAARGEWRRERKRLEEELFQAREEGEAMRRATTQEGALSPPKNTPEAAHEDGRERDREAPPEGGREKSPEGGLTDALPKATSKTTPDDTPLPLDELKARIEELTAGHERLKEDVKEARAAAEREKTQRESDEKLLEAAREEATRQAERAREALSALEAARRTFDLAREAAKGYPSGEEEEALALKASETRRVWLEEELTRREQEWANSREISERLRQKERQILQLAERQSALDNELMEARRIIARLGGQLGRSEGSSAQSRTALADLREILMSREREIMTLQARLKQIETGTPSA